MGSFEPRQWRGRWERLLLIAAVAYLLLTLYGLEAIQSGQARSFSVNTKKTLSVLSCGVLQFCNSKTAPKTLFRTLKHLFLKQKWG